MKWHIDDDKKANHFELLEKLVGQYPECKEIIRRVLQHDISPVFDEIMALTAFEIADVRYKLTTKRADFIIKMLGFRLDYVKKIFA